MIKLNRTTEYGLIALRHMSRKSGGAVTSAREIADTYGLPFEITAKTLQRLKDTGLIQSVQGARGGYALKKSLDEVTLADFLREMEGPQAVVACASIESGPGVSGHACDCEYDSKCQIGPAMKNLNNKVLQFLSGIRLSEFAAEAVPLVQLTSFEPKAANSQNSVGHL